MSSSLLLGEYRSRVVDNKFFDLWLIPFLLFRFQNGQPHVLVRSPAIHPFHGFADCRVLLSALPLSGTRPSRPSPTPTPPRPTSRPTPPRSSSSVSRASQANYLHPEADASLCLIFPDHEEVGSVSHHGAESNMLPNLVKRLTDAGISASSSSDVSVETALAKSFLISADMGHG